MRTKARGLIEVCVAAAVALFLVLGWVGPIRAAETVSDRVVNSLLLRGDKLQEPLAQIPSRAAKIKGIADDGPQAAEREPLDLMGKLKGMGIAGLIMGGVILLAFGAWKHGWRLKRSRAYSSSIHLISTKPLGDKKAIAVVEVEGQRLVVGMTAHQVTLLTALPANGDEAGELSERHPAHRAQGEPSWSRSSAEYDFGQRSYPDIQGIFSAMRG